MRCEEFRIPDFDLRSGVWAHAGRSGLGGDKSGTNAFHGTAFEYLRNDMLDANDWFADNKGLRKPELRQNDFGGVLGRPNQ